MSSDMVSATSFENAFSDSPVSMLSERRALDSVPSGSGASSSVAETSRESNTLDNVAPVATVTESVSGRCTASCKVPSPTACEAIASGNASKVIISPLAPSRVLFSAKASTGVMPNTIAKDNPIANVLFIASRILIYASSTDIPAPLHRQPEIIGCISFARKKTPASLLSK